MGKMNRLLAGSVAVLGFAATGAFASPLSVVGVVGGVPTGVSYHNLDNLALGNATQAHANATISFTGSAQAVQGSSSGIYAAPYLSNNNGALFGDPNNGPDGTTYLTTGIGSVTFQLNTPEEYLGLLWGSVDTYNSISFYNGASLIGTVTGTDVTAAANGNQGANGTYYVNIDSSASFDKVVFSSTRYAFEFDNLATNSTPIGVPEPATLALMGLGLAGLGLVASRRAKRG